MNTSEGGILALSTLVALPIVGFFVGYNYENPEYYSNFNLNLFPTRHGVGAGVTLKW